MGCTHPGHAASDCREARLAYAQWCAPCLDRHTRPLRGDGPAGRDVRLYVQVVVDGKVVELNPGGSAFSTPSQARRWLSLQVGAHIAGYQIWRRRRALGGGIEHEVIERWCLFGT